jgi:hypothetical protein
MFDNPWVLILIGCLAVCVIASALAVVFLVNRVDFESDSAKSKNPNHSEPREPS